MSIREQLTIGGYSEENTKLSILFIKKKKFIS